MSVALTFNVQIPLRALRERITNSYMNRRPNFVGINLGDNCVGMVFRSGKAVVTGIRTLDVRRTKVRLLTRFVRRALRTVQHATGVRVVEQYVKTILAVGKLSSRVRVCPYRLQNESTLKLAYEPEINNAIILKQGRVTLKLFPSTGTVVAFGKNFSEMVIFYSQLCAFYPYA